MKSSPFSYTNFFSDTGIFKELFDSYTYPWEVLPNISEFILGFRNSEKAQEFTEIKENVYVGKNVEIDDTARILGAAIICDNSSIGHAAFIRGDVLMGENVHVGHATEVKHSVVLSNTALAHLNYVGDSIIGSSCNISGGSTLANWRLDKAQITIKHDEERIPTNMEKLGSILGDGCFIGVNAVLNPGTVLAKESLVFPLISIKGTHLDKKVFK